MKHSIISLGLLVLLMAACSSPEPEEVRQTTDFNRGWQFTLDEVNDVGAVNADGINWRDLDLPHDWSIEGAFSPDHPAGVGGGALPGGVGWYKKEFMVPVEDSAKHISIRFDGVYMNSEVWINGQYLGKRPNGYIGFTYDLTPYLNLNSWNRILVKVDNSQQPNSRWYSGSGIYRNLWLTKTDLVHVVDNGTYVSTTDLTQESAELTVETTLENHGEKQLVRLFSEVWFDGIKLAEKSTAITISTDESKTITHYIPVPDPELWDINDPNLYELNTLVYLGDELVDTYKTTFGIRTTEFDLEKGFLLNGEPVKMLGVNNHHDLGALGAAVNKRAIERQLEILKEMGVNAIRTAHNPPAPELLELTDEMGFLVMDEVFDVWSKPKVEYDYSMYWEDWHERDLRDFIKRDRNHPSVVLWSIGNEILEQWGDPAGTEIARELAEIVRSLDTTRAITDGMNPPNEGNTIATSGALDVIGYNYHHELYPVHYENFPDTPMIATETTSALATRGAYDIYLPSDSIRRWPERWDNIFEDGNPDNTVSAYDHVSTPWGSTHEETWKVVKAHDFISGMFIWTGFDYLGEPTPYVWPSRSSYFGVVDLAGFPKDSYYMYQSEWTDKTVLHLLPHWNWSAGDTVDVWAYYNKAEEVELFLNGESLGTRSKSGDDLHVQWRIPYQAGELKTISRKDGETVKENIIQTAGDAASIKLSADRIEITADGYDLSFITIEILDADGNPVPKADNLIQFELSGPGKIAGVDNGDPTSHEPFKAEQRKAFNGKALLIVQSTEEPGEITITATSEGLSKQTISIKTH